MMERYRPTGTPINDHERELLDCLVEECAEVTKAACKLLRFGKQSYPGYGDNQKVLAGELGDLREVMRRMEHQGLVRVIDVLAGERRKRKRLDRCRAGALRG